MSEATKQKMTRMLSKVLEHIKSQPGFLESEELRQLYVCMLTAQGAVMFDDLSELGALCASFAKAKSRDAVIAG
jgi:hypothetical protein